MTEAPPAMGNRLVGSGLRLSTTVYGFGTGHPDTARGRHAGHGIDLDRLELPCGIRASSGGSHRSWPTVRRHAAGGAGGGKDFWFEHAADGGARSCRNLSGRHGVERHHLSRRGRGRPVHYIDRRLNAPVRGCNTDDHLGSSSARAFPSRPSACFEPSSSS